jgi:hypothetical protein
MRLSVALVCLLSNVALAQNAPAPAAPKHEGRLIDPFGHMPHPRDGMRLPDPRTAAEKAAADGVVSPDAPPPKPSPAPARPAPAQPAPAPAPVATPPVAASSAGPAAASGPAASTVAPSQIAASPATTGAPAGTFPAFRRSKTPFGVTTMRIKMKHEEEKPPTPPREGSTFQAGLGAGWIHLSSEYAELTSPRGTAGLSLAYGSWLNSGAAVLFRASAVAIPYSDGTLAQVFLGPALQIWPTDALWFGFGAGFGMLEIDLDASSRSYRSFGVAGELRIGHTLFQRSGHALDISLEVSPALFELPSPGDDTTVVGTSLGVLFGYQLL